MGGCRLEIPGTNASAARATSLLLTTRIEFAKPGVESAVEALRIQKYQLVLPAEPKFSATEKLTLYFGIEGAGTGEVEAAIAIRSAEKVVRELPQGDLYPWPDSPSRIIFLKQYELSGLAPGSYTLEARIRDSAKATVTVQTAAFSIR